jgi:hypothetical protein
VPPERAGALRAEDRSAPKVQPITKSATPPPADEGSDEAAQAGDDLAQGDANPHDQTSREQDAIAEQIGILFFSYGRACVSLGRRRCCLVG